MWASPWLIVAVWVIGGLITLAGALTFSEAAALLPEAGGEYVYLTRAYGGLVGLPVRLGLLRGGQRGRPRRAEPWRLRRTSGSSSPSAPRPPRPWPLSACSPERRQRVGVKAGAMFSNIFTVLKLLGIAGLVGVGLALGSSGTTDFSLTLAGAPSGLWNALALGMVGVLWSYGGWQHATYASAEVKNPQRTLPLAMILGTAAVTAIYLLANLAYMFMLTPAQMAASPRVAADAVSTLLGPVGGSLISLAIVISTFGVIGIYTLTAPRIYYAMAADGVFFRKVAEIHPRFGTPAFSIMLQSLWAAVLVLFWGTFENLISYVVFTDWIFFALAGASVIVLRRKMPDAPRPYRVPGYPWVPLFFVGTSAWFVAMTLVAKPAQAWAGLGFLGLGVPVYYYWKRTSTRGAP